MNVGILGGTFNPVHLGHLRLAQDAAQALNLDRTVLMPCAIPPHKNPTGLLPFELRVDLLRAATEHSPLLGVDTLEAELPVPSYTWNLLTAWRERRGSVPWFLLGDEDFAVMSSWRKGNELPGLADFAVVPRSGADASLFLHTVRRLNPTARVHPVSGRPGRLEASPVAGRRCVFLPLPCLDISASKVRALWTAGSDISRLVPAEVAAMLADRRAVTARCWGRPMSSVSFSPGPTGFNS